MALVRGRDPLNVGLGAGSNLGQEVKEQRENQQAVSQINKQLVESGTTFDPQTQAINVQGYQQQQQKYNNYVRDLDTYNKNLAINAVEGSVEQIVPEISISNGAVKFTGTKSALNSNVAKELKIKIENDFNGLDLGSPDVQNAIAALNNEVHDTVRKQVIQDGLGWEPENYDRYKYAVQTMQSTAPMKSSNLIEARDKDGKIVKKTPQQWVDYWMNNYDSDQRRDMFLNGARVYKEGGDGLDAIPYVIMSAGMQSDNAVYDFNAGDAWRALVRGAGAEYAKLGQGIVNTTQDITQDLGGVKRRFSTLGLEEPTDRIEIISPQQFNSVISRLRGGGPSMISESALSDEEKQILSLGSNGGTEWNRGAFGQDKALDIRAIADGVDYQTYVSRANDLNHQIQQNASLKEFDEQVQKDADVYAEAATTVGRFAGIIGRFAAEALAVKGLTGINIMGLGERVASKIWSSARGAEFAENAIPIAQTVGRAVVGATSSIPENVVQVAIDNIATGRLDTNNPFMTPEEVAQDTAMTFLVSLVLAGGKAIGSSALNRGVREAAAELEKRNIVIDADDLVRGTRQASEAVEENRVTRINDDGRLEYEDMNGETVVFDKAPAVEVFANTDNPKLQSAISDYIDDRKYKDFDYDASTDTIYRTQQLVETLPSDKGDQLGLVAVVDSKARIDPRTGLAHINGELTNAIPPKMAEEIKLRHSTILNDATARTMPGTTSLKWLNQKPITYSSIGEALSNRPTVHDTPAVRQWISDGTDVAVRELDRFMDTDFRNKFPKYTDTSQMVKEWDAMNWLVRNGTDAEDVVGKKVFDESTGNTITITKNTKASYEYFDKNFITPQGLRLASRQSLGLEGDFNQLGYLPHSYINSNSSTFEEAMSAGALWRRNTGTTTTGSNGNFISSNLSDNLRERYSIYAENMLNDIVADQNAVAKFMEELSADGVDVSAETAYRAVKKTAELNKKLADTPTNKDFVKELTDVEGSVKDTKAKQRIDDIKEAKKNSDRDAKKLGAARAISENYRDVYRGGRVVNGKINILVDMQANARRLETTRGTLYDNGYRTIIAHAADAKAIIDSYISNGDLRGTIIDYLERFSNRSEKGREYIADKWLTDIYALADDSGNINLLDVEQLLSQKVRFEGITMLNKWLAVENFDNFSNPAQKFLNEFVYQEHTINQALKHPLIQSKINEAADFIVKNRYRSLFYGNVRNAILQLSEGIRVAENYGYKDAIRVIGRLATDSDFVKRVDDLQGSFNTFSNRSSTARFTDMHKYDEAAANTAKGLERTETVMDFRRVKGDFGDFMNKVDDVATAPITLAEDHKNRLFIAAALDAAEDAGLTGFAQYEKVMNDFNRLALAANEFGRMSYANNAFARMGFFLQNFNLRFAKLLGTEVRDHFNDGAFEGAKYLTKFLGSRVGLWFIMSKLGYSWWQASGLDPFGMMERDYTGISESATTDMDRFVRNNPLFAGGITSMISDGYFAMRQAYEQSKQTPAEMAAKTEGFGLDFQGLIPEDFFGAIAPLFPGAGLANRVVNMNDLVDKGIATSKKGTLMYESPDNWIDVMRGYLFGRTSTPNAMDYFRTADPLRGLAEGGVAGLGREFGRVFGEFGQFDPIDSENYTDWFNGTWQDNQRWMSGIYYFRNKRDEILDRYGSAANTFATDEEKDAWQNQMNRELSELYGEMRRFSDAYERVHPEGITPNMMSQLLYSMNNYRVDPAMRREDAEKASMQEYNRSLSRYSQAGLPAVTRLQGPTERSPDTEISLQESPQYRNALQGRYGVPAQAAVDVKNLYNSKWKTLRKEYADEAYKKGNSYAKRESIQREYIAKVREDLDPLVRVYGTAIFSNDDVGDVIEDVFSGMIPYADYGKNKRGRFQSMPYATADYKKILQQNYYKNYPSSGSISYTTSSESELKTIRERVDAGRRSEAKALARALLNKVRNNTAAISGEQLKWLQGVING